METQNSNIIVEEEFNSSAEKIRNDITNRNEMVKWFFEDIPSFEAKIGFTTQFNVDANGKHYLHKWRVLKVIPQSYISYSWEYEDYNGYSEVAWELIPGKEKTILQLTVSGLDSFPGDNPDFSRESCLNGWTYFIKKRLKEFLSQQ